MCLIAFAWNAHPRWRLLLAGNRDESHARPSAALARWDDMPIVAGRDLEAGGTWLGVTDDARCAVVTNVRDPRDAQSGSSRGLLIRDYLVGTADATGHAHALLHDAAAYRPFNLLTFDAQAAFYLGNRPQPHAQVVTTGIHGLSNADFDAPWPKTRVLMQRLHGWIDQGGEADFGELFAALADEQVAPDDQLPDTGVGLELERRLSSAFIRGADYGTRASTVVAISHTAGGVIAERRFGPHGRFLGEIMLRFGDVPPS
ncbi:MAG: NRDE family protein [Rhodanobacter sp.]